jgi:hypothetical protein
LYVMVRALNSSVVMRSAYLLASVAFLAACRGERTPRDYQNSPPAMTHPVTTSSQSPTANGMPGPAPEPSKGAEGQNQGNKPESPTAATLTLKDQAPTTDSQHATQMTTTAATGTHLAAPP